MTISVFWEIVKPVAQTISFKELCIKEGFVQKHRNIGTMIFGVDAYLWITQCQAVFHKPRHAQMGKNPELKALFYKLAALNQAGVTAVFVFDGPNKPSVKRDKQVRAKPHWLVAEFIKLIELFGFHYHMAPGEADSELGYLDNFGCIDGILTDDGDVAVFGASRIIRNPRRMNKDIPDEITVYTSESFKNDIGLTRGGILLLAILGGGDYDTVGLAGCGSHIALALAHCGFGDSLLQASENMAEAELEEFLIQWREDLRAELATNSRGFLRSKQNTLSTKIPETFPSLRVLSLYVQPTTSWSNGFVPPATDKWIVKLPALPELAVYCNKEFGWNPAAIAEKFRRLIFSGLCTRRLTMPLNIEQQIHNHVIKGCIQEEHPPLSAFVNILRVS
ncbi:PIN domain-like protein, partial [Mycena olivaceomarginata]